MLIYTNDRDKYVMACKVNELKIEDNPQLTSRNFKSMLRGRQFLNLMQLEQPTPEEVVALTKIANRSPHALLFFHSKPLPGYEDSSKDPT